MDNDTSMRPARQDLFNGMAAACALAADTTDYHPERIRAAVAAMTTEGRADMTYCTSLVARLLVEMWELSAGERFDARKAITQNPGEHAYLREAASYIAAGQLPVSCCESCVAGMTIAAARITAALMAEFTGGDPSVAAGRLRVIATAFTLAPRDPYAPLPVPGQRDGMPLALSSLRSQAPSSSPDGGACSFSPAT